MDMCNHVSTPGLQMTDKDLATEEQLPELLARFHRRVTGRLLYVARQREGACARNEFSNKHSLGTSGRVLRFLVKRQLAKLGTISSQPRVVVIGEVV